jgi:hypothetical protein
VLLSGCGTPPDDVAVEPFAPRVVWPTGLAARALAVLDGSSGEVALAFQLQNEVGLLDLVGGDLVPAAVGVGEGPMAIAALDADGDGALELATANSGDGTVSLVGRAGAVLEVRATGVPAARPKHVCGADLDGDGRQEVIVTVGLDGDAGAAGIEVWRLADAGLSAVGSGWALEGAFAATNGDVDGDGDLDVIAVLPETDEVAWAVNDGAGGLRPTGRAPVCRTPRAAAMLDERIAVACHGGLALVRPETRQVELVPYDGNVYDLVAGDFDRDGSTDLAAVDLAHDAVVLWRGRAEEGLGVPSLRPVGRDPVALVATDLGADGDLDLVVSAFATRTVDVLENRLASDERTPR